MCRIIQDNWDSVGFGGLDLRETSVPSTEMMSLWDLRGCPTDVATSGFPIDEGHHSECTEPGSQIIVHFRRCGTAAAVRRVGEDRARAWRPPIRSSAGECGRPADRSDEHGQLRTGSYRSRGDESGERGMQATKCRNFVREHLVHERRTMREVRWRDLLGGHNPCDICSLSEAELSSMVRPQSDVPILSIPCREIFVRGSRPTAVEGPAPLPEAAQVHAGFWV